MWCWSKYSVLAVQGYAEHTEPSRNLLQKMLPVENTLTSSSKFKSSPDIIINSSKTANNTMNQNTDSKYYTVSL